jgi:hypothetical protein
MIIIVLYTIKNFREEEVDDEKESLKDIVYSFIAFLFFWMYSGIKFDPLLLFFAACNGIFIGFIFAFVVKLFNVRGVWMRKGSLIFLILFIVTVLSGKFLDSIFVNNTWWWLFAGEISIMMMVGEIINLYLRKERNTEKYHVEKPVEQRPQIAKKVLKKIE